MDTLGPLCKDMLPVSPVASKLAIRRTKATALLKEGLANVYRKTFHERVKVPGFFFSLIMDETTDQSNIKQCAFMMIYYDDHKNQVATKFFDMVEMPSGTTEELFNCLKACLKNKNIPLSNLVGFCGRYHKCNVW